MEPTRTHVMVGQPPRKRRVLRRFALTALPGSVYYGEKQMNILDSRFKYTNAAATDIRKLFDRIQPGWNKTTVKLKARRARLPDNVRTLNTVRPSIGR